MRYFAFITLISLLGTLTGCDRYLVTFNEQPVYTPPVLFTGYDINDPALRSCVAQTIVDAGIHRAKNLSGLNCSAAGIAQLDGLEIFGSLETLILANNDIIRIEPLLKMPSLITVDLTGNPSLDCTLINNLSTRGIRITLPGHCQK